MSFFNVTVTGLGTIDSDVTAEIKDISAKIPPALQYIGSEMTANLQKHIKEDWYTPWRPDAYERRTDNPSLGTPLGSTENMHIAVAGPTHDQRLTFTYLPTGEHAEEKWHQRDGDELIKWIQHGAGDIPARPFWNNFVSEQEHAVITNLEHAMRPYKMLNTDTRLDLSDSYVEGQIFMFGNGLSSDDLDDVFADF